MKATDAKKIEKLLEKNKRSKKRIESFKEVMQELSGADPQKMSLWVEIYDNASGDRTIASALFTQAFTLLGSSSSDHASMGPILVKYLERMSKSNEQLLTLAQIVAKEVEKKVSMDTNDIFSQIEESE